MMKEMSQPKRLTIPAEVFYVFGIVFVAFGVALMEKADLGLSTIVGPAYVLYRHLTRFWPVVSFGMMEYTFQAFLLIIMIIILKRFRLSYLFSFVTAVVYGFTLNGFMALVSPAEVKALPLRLLFYAVGMLFCAFGVASMLHTYISPEVYELIVKEIPRKFHLNLSKFKTAFDILCFTTTVILSFVFFGFGHFVGIGWGTLVCALVNGTIIGRMCAIIDRRVTVVDLLPLRRSFE